LWQTINCGRKSQSLPNQSQTVNERVFDVPLPHNLRQLKEIKGERLIIVSVDRGDKQE
jgi:hypothetical protein